MRQFATACLTLLCALGAQAQTFDVTVKNMFAVSPDSLTKLQALQNTGTVPAAAVDRLTRSRYTDRRAPVDTLVRFTAVMLSDPFNSGLASPTATGPGRVHVFVRDVAAATDPAGMRGYVAQIVPGNGTTAYDEILKLAPGAVIRLTGSIAYFNQQPQISPTTLEVVALDYVAAGYPAALGQPILMALSDLNKPGTPDPNSTNPQATLNLANFPWNAFEYVRLENLAVETNAAFGQRFNVTYADPARTTFIYQSDISLRYRNDRAGTTYESAGFNVRTPAYVPPAVGARVNVQGFTMPYTADFVNYFNPTLSITIVPFEDADVQVLAGAPPSVANLSTPAGLVNGASNVVVTGNAAAAPDRTIASVALAYCRLDAAGVCAESGTAPAALVSGNQYRAEIPASAFVDGAFYRYSLTATDNAGSQGSSPNGTFRVLANGVRRIEHVQRTADGSATASPLAGTRIAAASGNMQIDAVVMTDFPTSGFVAFQDDPALGPWTGVEADTVADATFSDVRTLRRGDRVRITGAKVFEASGLTRLDSLTFTVTGTGAAYADKLVTTTALAGAGTAEAHEGMRLRLENVAVVETNADAAAGSNFGEFTVRTVSGTGALRVDDLSKGFPDLYNNGLTAGARFDFVAGLLRYSNNNFKLEPESLADVARAVGVERGLAADFGLGRIAPNPAGPGRVAVALRTFAGEPTRLDVFDVLGRRVATLADGVLPAGDATAHLDTNGLAAGVYVVRLSQGARTATQTLTVVR